MNFPIDVFRRTTAVKDLRRLDRRQRARIADKVEEWSDTGVGDLCRLKGTPSGYRLSFGDWRVILAFDSEQFRVDIVRVLPRGSAYKP